MKSLLSIILVTSFLTFFSCKDDRLRERELAIREREVALKEKELSSKTPGISQIVTPTESKNSATRRLPIKTIIGLAQKHFEKYKSNLEGRNLAVGLQKEYTGDFTGDGIEDVIIYYSIEPTDGGNYMAGQGLILYENTGNNINFITRYEPKYLFSLDKISATKIFINHEEYADGDPRCCPSIHTSMELTLKQNTITEKKALAN